MSTFTFAQHMALAQLWAMYHGKRGTEKQALKIMGRQSAETLARMLAARRVQLPAGCDANEVSR